jgi:hypothetical protein
VCLGGDRRFAVWTDIFLGDTSLLPTLLALSQLGRSPTDLSGASNCHTSETQRSQISLFRAKDREMREALVRQNPTPKTFPHIILYFPLTGTHNRHIVRRFAFVPV